MMKKTGLFGVGYNALKFTSGSPIEVTGSPLNNAAYPGGSLEANSAISDGNGDLLFYSDGVSVFDSTNTAMPNGTSNLNGNYSATSGVVIAHVPGSCNEYYIFHLRNITGTINDLYYSRVDMSLPGNGTIPSPLGDVVTGQTNMLITTDTLAEKMLAIQKGITEDYWIVVRSALRAEFYAFEITSAGVNTTPVVSTLSSYVYPFSSSPTPIGGWLAVSPQNDAIAEANIFANSYLYDFDNTTGIVSNQDTLAISTFPISLYEFMYGVEFSPNGDYIYMGAKTSTASDIQVLQFDCTAGFGNVKATRIQTDITPVISSNEIILSMHLQKDGIIYFNTSDQTSMSRITDPDNWSAPGVDYASLPVTGGTISSCLSNDFHYFQEPFLPSGIAGPDRNICVGDSTTIGCSGCDSIEGNYFWEPADSVINPNNAIAQTVALSVTNTFTVYVIRCGDTITSDTVIVNVGALPAPSIYTPDSWYCMGDNITNLTSDNGSLWFSDSALTVQVAADSFYTPPPILGTTTYYVIDTTGSCYSLADSVTVTFDTCSYPCPLIQNQLTNGDFETFSACPTGPSELPNATGWIDVQGNSNDYFNCSYFGTTNPGFNSSTTGMFLPPSGTGYTGIFLNGTGLIGREGFGQQVTLKKCIEYTIQLRVAHNLDDGPPDNDLCIYGGNTAMTAPCMSTYDQLICISKDSISLNWNVFTLTFIPAQNYSYIAFGGACPTVGTASIGGYVYIDDVFLCEKPCLTTWIDNITIIPIADDTCGMNTGSMTVDFTTICYTGFNFEWKLGAVVMSTDSIATGLAAGFYTLGITDSNCSTYMIGPSISAFNPITSIVITPSSASICTGASISLLASGATNYSWSPSTGLSCTSCPNPVATPTSTTTYQVVGSTGPCSDSTTITITVSSSINTLDTALICAGDSLFLGGTWQTTAGNYKDTLTSSGGCDSIVATNLSIIPPNGSSNNANVCPGDSIFVQGAWQTIAGTYYDTLTSILGCDSVIETVLSVDTVYSISSSVSICQGDSVLLPGGSYTSIAGIFTDSFSTVTGCDSVFITNVTVDTVFDATITPVNAICANTGILMLTAADGGGTWSGTGITNADSGYFDPSLAGPGTHEIIYTIGGSCGDSDTINISVYEVPSLSILEVAESCDGVNDGSVDLTVTGGTMPYAYLWDDPVSSTTDTLMALPPGTYTVVVTDANLCTVTDNANVLTSSTPCTAPYLYIPNIFSPNGDGENDMLYVQGAGVAEIIFIIYDRWGEKIFETNDLIDGWDGSYQGKPMNEAVFVYYVKASLINNEIIERKGNISIVR